MENVFGKIGLSNFFFIIFIINVNKPSKNNIYIYTLVH